MARGLKRVAAGSPHAFAAEFDAKKPVHFEGTITKNGVDESPCVAPHGREETRMAAWRTGRSRPAPNVLFRRLHQESLLPGTKVVVDGYQAKNGEESERPRPHVPGRTQTVSRLLRHRRAVRVDAERPEGPAEEIGSAAFPITRAGPAFAAREASTSDSRSVIGPCCPSG